MTLHETRWLAAMIPLNEGDNAGDAPRVLRIVEPGENVPKHSVSMVIFPTIQEEASLQAGVPPLVGPLAIWK
jgi:hypothetical protein